jgi:DNA-binding ferritin-like protein
MFYKNKSNKNPQSKKRKTSKRQIGVKKSNQTKNTNNRNKSHIVKVFLEVLNMVKLYHWKTHSYAQHKATDELYERLNENIDKFVEILLGKDESRIKMLEKRIDLVDAKNVKDFKSRIYEYRTFLTDINMYFDAKRDSDLLSLRDEILGNVNQFLYLMTFDK